MNNFRILLFAGCFLPVFSASAQQGKVLSYEITVEERQIVKQVLPAGSAVSSSVREQEFLIDEIDVYALSPAAKFLALPHMVSLRHHYENSHDINWERIIARAAARYGVAENLIRAVIKTESNFLAHAVSVKGAQGAMQIMPETQKELGLENPLNAEDNVLAGTKYLKQQLDYFNGDVSLALAAYNAGAGNVLKYEGIPPFKETQNFVRNVLAHMEAD